MVFDTRRISHADLLKAFWENHDPTLGMRQGNDVGTQCRPATTTGIGPAPRSDQLPGGSAPGSGSGSG